MFLLPKLSVPFKSKSKTFFIKTICDSAKNRECIPKTLLQYSTHKHVSFCSYLLLRLYFKFKIKFSAFTSKYLFGKQILCSLNTYCSANLALVFETNLVKTLILYVYWCCNSAEPQYKSQFIWTFRNGICRLLYVKNLSLFVFWYSANESILTFTKLYD